MKLKVYREVTLERKYYSVYEVQDESESILKVFLFESANEDEVYHQVIKFAKHLEQEGLRNKKQLIYESI
jgi:predicted nucleotidyltransferase component of viral defense system